MEKKETTVWALGFFDGVHLGHGALLRACRELADKLGARAGVITFATHPDTLVLGRTPKLINTPSDRKRLLTEKYAMDEVVFLPFDREMMTLPWEDFFCLLQTQYGACGLVCGEDFRFGYRGGGTAEGLKRICGETAMPCRVIPAQYLDGILISSTFIRTLLQEGRMQEAGRFLGHAHILSGVVEEGKHLGRKLGFPTANLSIPPETDCLRHGVYACRALTRYGTFPAVTNVGLQPTVGGTHLTAEAHLPDFSENLYGTVLTLEFLAFVRPEKAFPSLEALQAEIRNNVAQVREIYKNP